jgi:mannan endo-1,6-alpha-mannosidase
MSAAELSFPGDIGGTSYLAAAQNVFSQQVSRWTNDSSVCGGGLRSLIQPSNQTAYTAKDAFSVGAFFQLAARLAIKTQNLTYTQWAQTAYSWAVSNGLVIEGTWSVYTSTNTSTNCSVNSIYSTQYSAASAAFLYGCSLMYNGTYSQAWVARTQGFLSMLNITFFQSSGANQITELSCRRPNICSPMQQVYLALTARWLASASNTAPFITAATQQLLLESGKSMAASCTQAGVCTVDGKQGLGQELTALDSVLAMLLGRGPGGSTPTTSGTGRPSSTQKSAADGRGDGWKGAIVMALLVAWSLVMVL